MADQDNKNELLAELLSKFKDLDTEDLLQGLLQQKKSKKEKMNQKKRVRLLEKKQEY